MEWKDEGIVLSARRHGETSLILTLLTQLHGKHAGYVRGGMGKKARGDYQAGNYLKIAWRSRIEEQLGNYSCEIISSNAVRIMYSQDKLACLMSACALSEATLPERESVHLAYDALKELIDVLTSDKSNKLWQILYVLWELNLLAELGFGLDFTNCAATGASEN
ncbi:MAG: DNA repair protein RecO, partial [Alphaproteobacteria bacterium]|nr:DNA repair protein RecO [Alphaproteobacteria bacterium]